MSGITTSKEKDTAHSVSKKANLRPLYARSVVNSLGLGMVNPFMGAYAVELGASSSEMGWFQSLASLSNNVMQVFWGKMSDRLGKRIPFIILGGLIISALWIPMMFVTNPSQLIVLIAIQALLGSMATPAWTALIGDLVPSLRLGRTSATINLWASVGSLIATLVSGIIIVSIGETLQQMFFIPFSVAVICGFISSFVMLSAKERRNNINSASKRGFLPEIFKMVTYAKKSPDFMRYSLAGAIFTFSMSIIWPLFSITLIKVLNASMLEIALLSVIQMTITIILQSRIGRLADTLGRKPLLVLFRFSLVTVPIAYAFAPNAYVLIGIGAFWGISMAMGHASMTAYLLDVTPEEHRGSFTAFYNLIMGVTAFFGSLFGGYLSDYTIGLFGLTLGLQIVYMISMVGRGIGAATYLTLRETMEKPS